MGGLVPSIPRKAPLFGAEDLQPAASAAGTEPHTPSSPIGAAQSGCAGDFRPQVEPDALCAAPTGLARARDRVPPLARRGTIPSPHTTGLGLAREGLSPDTLGYS